MSAPSGSSVSLSELVRALSPARLAPYRQRCATDQEAVCLYLWNLALSRELYPILNSVEVALRNAIHTSGTAHFGTPDWFRNPLMIQHEPRQLGMLNDAQYSLWRDLNYPVRRIRQGQAPLPPPSSVDDHLAARTFGFWTGIMNGPYELRLWSAASGGVNLIHAAFPHAGRSNRQRSVIFPMVDRLRKLRNRVSHNEPILWWQPGLQTEYQAAVKVLGWISPALANFVQYIDGFADAYRTSHRGYMARVTLTI